MVVHIYIAATKLSSWTIEFIIGVDYKSVITMQVGR